MRLPKPDPTSLDAGSPDGARPDTGGVRLPCSRKADRETGSAYVVVLVVLFIVTLLGLSLSLVTQTEFQIGANERTVTRVFYAADTGISSAIARALVRSEHSSQVLNLTDTGEPFAGNMLIPGFNAGEAGTRVEVSPFYLIQGGACNLCEINNSGTYSDRGYERANHAVTAVAQRFITTDQGVTRKVIAERALTTMIELQPWKPPLTSLDAIDQTTELEKIKF